MQAAAEAAVGAEEKPSSTIANLAQSAWNGMSHRHQLASLSPNLRAPSLVNAPGLMKQNKCTNRPIGNLLKTLVHKMTKKTIKLSRLKTATLLQLMLVVLLHQLLCSTPDHS